MPHQLFGWHWSKELWDMLWCSVFAMFSFSKLWYWPFFNIAQSWGRFGLCECFLWVLSLSYDELWDIWDASSWRPLQVSDPIFQSVPQLDTIVPTGAIPLHGSVVIFSPNHCWYVTSYVTLCLVICCKSFTAWILPEFSKRYLLLAIVGCKLYKVCFCSPVFCQKLELGPVAPTSLNFKSYLSPDLRTIQPAVSGS